MSNVTGRPIAKAWFARLIDGEIISLFPFQYNPTTINRERNVGFALVSPPGSPLPTANFQSISGDAISFTMLLDATSDYREENEGVGAQKAELESYTQPEIERFINELGQFISPPEVLFGFGADSWRVIIPRMGFRDVRFNGNGFTTRCFVDIRAQTYFSHPSEVQAHLSRVDRLRSFVVQQEVG